MCYTKKGSRDHSHSLVISICHTSMGAVAICQEIRQAIIKRNALMPGTSKKRLAAQKAKASMLKRSGTTRSSLGGCGDFGIGLGIEAPEEDADEDERGAEDGEDRSSLAIAGG